MTLADHPISCYLALHGETAELVALALGVRTNCPGCGAVVAPFSLAEGVGFQDDRRFSDGGEMVVQERCEKCLTADRSIG